MRPDPSGSGSSVEEFGSPGALFFLSSLFLHGGGMDLSKVGVKMLNSVWSARSLGFIPAPSDRPEVPARAAAAATVARALAGLPPHQRFNLPSSSEELISIYGSRPHGQIAEDLEEEFYEESFDPVKNVLEHIPSEQTDVAYFEKQATLRLAQLDRIAERLACHVMEHHEEMVKGMQLVMELEQDLKVANVICMNGRRHLASSMHEVSRDLVVNANAKKKQALLDMLPVLMELRRALDMQMELEILVEEGNYFRAFQVLSEYLQVLDSFSELTAVQEMSRGVEAWLARTLQKLDSLLLGVCQNFSKETYVTVLDAYALIGDTTGLAEKIQSFFMQEILSETHSILKNIVQEDIRLDSQGRRLTYSDICAKIPESKFCQCLLNTLDTLFRLVCSYYQITSFLPEVDRPETSSLNIVHRPNDTLLSAEGLLADSASSVSSVSNMESDSFSRSACQTQSSLLPEEHFATCSSYGHEATEYFGQTIFDSYNGDHGDVKVSSDSNSPFYRLRKDSATFVAQTLDRGRKNLWQLTTSRISVLLSCPAVCSTSMHQFLRNYEDLNVFILAGEAFCGMEAVEFRQKLKIVCENYLVAFHRQNICALRMVLEKETWAKMSSESMKAISLAGLVGDGAPLIASSNRPTLSVHSSNISHQTAPGYQKNGFSHWLNITNPFLSKMACSPKESLKAHILSNGSTISCLGDVSIADPFHNESPGECSDGILMNGSSSILEDENEDLLADFIDEDSQLPSRISKPMFARSRSAYWNDEEMISAQTGSSLCLLRLMDKYARLMQKLEVVNVEFFKGICQLFGIFFHFIFETFGQREVHSGGKVPTDSYRLKFALSKITQDCDQWIRHQSVSSSSSSPTSLNTSYAQMDVTPTIPASTIFGHAPSTSFGLKERCAAVEAISLVARVLHRSKPHLQSMLLQHNMAAVEDFF
uniref:Coiled-coil domain-containing protein 132 n=1 Tax=Anthurium amnicola TaxID=1678845 RepID=A0A1D1XEN0_9ARAE